MLGLRPIGGAPVGAITLPDPIPDGLAKLTNDRGARFATVLEINGFPLDAFDNGSGAHPIGGGPIGANIGILGDFAATIIRERTLFLSDHPYRTGPRDTSLPSMWTEARVTRRADIERITPIRQEQSRRSQQTVGAFDALDHDRFLRDETDAFSFRRRAARVHLVELGRPWAESVQVAAGLCGPITSRRGTSSIALEDASDVLDLPLVPRVYGGRGGRDGDEGLRGTAPPVGWGPVRLARPVLEDGGRYIYRYTDFPSGAVHRVEERGLPFEIVGDVATYQELQLAADEITLGQVVTCINDGSLAIGHGAAGPAGEVRVSFDGARRRGAVVDRVGPMLLDMLDFMGVSPGFIDRLSFESLPDWRYAYYFGGGQSPSAASVFNEVCRAIYATYGSVNDERLGVRLIRPPGTQPVAATLAEQEIFSVSETDPPQQPIKQQTVAFDPVATPYSTDEIGNLGLTVEEVRERTNAHLRSVVRSNPAAGAQNLAAVVGDEVFSGVVDEVPARDAVNRTMDVWEPGRKAFSIECALSAAGVRSGDEIVATHPDLGDRSGLPLLAYGVRIQFSRRRVTIDVLG